MNASLSPHKTDLDLQELLIGATPVIAQYLTIKAGQGDALLFFRMGDFYELFFEDAVITANALGLALAKRGKHKGEDIQMCGVPVHAADSYMAKLIRQGFRVAVCDQLEDASEAKKRGGKSVVKRGIVRIITAGTLTEDALLDARGPNRLLALSVRAGQLALAAVELSTGEIECLEIEPEQLGAHLSALRPSETLVNDRLLADEGLTRQIKHLGGVIQPQGGSLCDPVSGEARLKRLYGVSTLDGYGQFSQAEVSALGLLAAYIEVTQAGKTPNLKPPRKLGATAFMLIDASTRASLEIDTTQRGVREGSLVSSLDMCVTTGGSRLLLSRLSRPLNNVSDINNRLDSVAWFLARSALTKDVRTCLSGLGDAARSLSRLGLGRGGPRDLHAIKQALRLAQSLETLMQKDQDLGQINTTLPSEIKHHLVTLRAHDDMQALLYKLESALIDDPPQSTRDGGFIRPNYNSNLNQTINLKSDSRKVILALEARLTLETGVALKIKYTSILGYFIEVSQKQAEGLSGHNFIHRQTLANQIRFSTPELIDLDARIGRASNEALVLELAIFDDLCDEVRSSSHTLQALFETFCALDVACGSAIWAIEYEATRPIIDDSGAFEARGAKHPVVFEALKKQGIPFTPNDCILDNEGQIGARLSIVTGPNMAGKSTYLRQNAILIIMAQSGLYVPAKQFRLGVVDRLFSRVGAGDDLAQGRSTFMMEMVETSAILAQATRRSFVILDEIGRGTATFDGLAIAWACAENLHEVIGARTLFATHYHEMARLETLLDHVDNISLAAKEYNGELIFLHEARRGAADRSYGVHVARLAGMPASLIARAKDILQRLENDKSAQLRLDDLPLFSSLNSPSVVVEAPPSPVEARLKSINPNDLSPREALDLVYLLHELIP